MTNVEMQGDVRPEKRSTDIDKTGERTAPNGRLAVLVGDLWAGYVVNEGEGSRGAGNTREMTLFAVDVLPNGELKIIARDKCPQPYKKRLSKRYHYDHEITLYEARTSAGVRCQLFTA